MRTFDRKESCKIIPEVYNEDYELEPIPKRLQSLICMKHKLNHFECFEILEIHSTQKLLFQRNKIKTHVHLLFSRFKKKTVGLFKLSYTHALDKTEARKGAG